MGPTKMLAFAGAATALITTTAANAADFPAAPPPQMVRAPVVEASGWYLRGDIGIGNQQFKSFDFTADRGRPLAGDLAHRPEGHRRTRSSSPPASATSGTTGCASTSPVNIAPTSKFKAVGSWNNGVGRALRRLRRRTSRQRCSWSTPISISAPGGASRRSSAPASAGAYHMTIRSYPTMRHQRRRPRRLSDSAYADADHRNGTSPGRCTPALPTRSPTRSRSNSPTATSTWARRRPAEISAAATAAAPVGGPRAYYHLGHQLARLQVRRALDAPAGAGLPAAADAPRLIGKYFIGGATARDVSRAVCFFSSREICEFADPQSRKQGGANRSLRLINHDDGRAGSICANQRVRHAPLSCCSLPACIRDARQALRISTCRRCAARRRSSRRRRNTRAGPASMPAARSAAAAPR